jgi:hypothetical protein
MNTRAAQIPRTLITLLVVTILMFISIGDFQGRAVAQAIPTDTLGSAPPDTTPPVVEVINPYFSIEHRTLADGTQIEGYIINGPPTPPAGYASESTPVAPSIDAVILPEFPDYYWVFGCSSVSGAMIAAYYDRVAYPNMYTGVTNGGVMPLTDSIWGTWSDGHDTYPNNPLIASHNGVDGRSTKGSIDDYWVQYGSSTADPYVGNWTQHTWGTAIGDYMKTSQSVYGNTDGSTVFYNYNSAKLTCSDMESLPVDPPYNVADVDGTYGRKLFYEARGYTVTDCYNQKTDTNGGGFTLANFQAEIDAGNPVLLNLFGHSIVGYGYEGSTIYIRDTWGGSPDYPTMEWNVGLPGMPLLSVSVVHLGGTSGPEMDVRGNSVSIADGDSTPSLSDRTDFGLAEVTGGSVSHTFTIHNLGDTDLNLTGVPKVSLSGAHAADFSVTLQPSSPVVAGGSTSFTVVFNPSDSGLRTAAISIANNDDNENPYNFAIQGSGTADPIILNTFLPLVSRPLPLPGTLNAVSDSNILQGHPGSNFGNTEDMLVGYDDYYDPDQQIGRGLIKFDLSAIPPGTSINNAILQVYYMGYYDFLNHSRTITSYRISSGWTEMGVTWSNQPSFAESYGSVNILANSTWRYVNLDVTNLVRAWINGTYPNYGIMLRGPEVSGSDSSWRKFATLDSSYVPKLVITYSGAAANNEPPVNLETLPENDNPLRFISAESVCMEYLTPVKCFVHR